MPPWDQATSLRMLGGRIRDEVVDRRGLARPPEDEEAQELEGKHLRSMSIPTTRDWD